MITVIHGPRQSGKTSNMDALMEHYGCKRVIDEYEPGSRAEGWVRRAQLVRYHTPPTREEWNRIVPQDGDLVLTTFSPSAVSARFPTAAVVVQYIRITDALSALACRETQQVEPAA